MNNKKISCADIEKLLEDFLYRKLSNEDSQLLQDHINICAECRKKTAADLKIEELLQLFYKYKTTKEIPSFDWNKFYIKLSSENITTKTTRFSWVPKFAFATLLGVLVVSLSISIFFKIKNIQYRKTLKLPLRNDYSYSQDSIDSKSQADTPLDDEEAYIKLTRKRSSKKQKRLLANDQKELAKKEVRKLYETDKASIPVKLHKSLKKEGGKEVTSENEKTGEPLTAKEGLAGRQYSSQFMSYSQKKAIPSPDESSFLVNIPLCNNEQNIFHATNVKRQLLTEKKCYTDNLLEVPLTILENEKSSKINIIEIIDPSCINCNNYYELIKNIIDNSNKTISYKILFYPVKHTNTLFFLFAESLYAVGENNKNNIRIMLESILKEMKKDRQRRKSVSEWRKYLIKSAKGITNLQQFLSKLRKGNHKSQIYKHIELVKLLKITAPAILFFKDTVLTKYTGKMDQENLEKAIKTLLKY